MENITLYNYFRSSTSYRVRIALNYKQIPFEYKAVHLLNNGGEQHSPEFRRINPQGEVPSLVHKGNVISQSMAIVEYLEEIYPSPPLLPSANPGLRARIRQFCENINSYLHPVNNLKILQYLEQHHGYDLARKEKWYQHWATQGFRALEEMVKGGNNRFCFGNELTLADVFLIPQIFSAKRFNVDVTPYPTLCKINDNCLELEAFIQAHPMNQPDAPPS